MDKSNIYAGGWTYESKIGMGNGVVYIYSGESWYQFGESLIPGGEINSIALNDSTIYAEGIDEDLNSKIYINSGRGWSLFAELESTQINLITLESNILYAGGCILDSSYECDKGVVYAYSGKTRFLVGKGNIPIRYGSMVLSMAIDKNQDVYVGTDLNSILISRGGIESWLKLPYSSYSSTLMITALKLSKF